MSAAILTRILLFWIAWIALAGLSWPGIAVGAVAAACAAFVSLRLVPAGPGLSMTGLLRFSLRFVAQSVRAGLDVARLAFSPEPDLAPGFVEYATGRPEGPGRHALAALMSLQPGTLPVGESRSGAMLVHGLDVRRPLAAQLAADEDAFDGMLRRPRMSGGPPRG